MRKVLLVVALLAVLVGSVMAQDVIKYQLTSAAQLTIGRAVRISASGTCAYATTSDNSIGFVGMTETDGASYWNLIVNAGRITGKLAAGKTCSFGDNLMVSGANGELEVATGGTRAIAKAMATAGAGASVEIMIQMEPIMSELLDSAFLDALIDSLLNDTTFLYGIRDSMLHDTIFGAGVREILLSDTLFLQGIRDSLVNDTLFLQAVREWLVTDHTFLTAVRDSLMGDSDFLDSMINTAGTVIWQAVVGGMTDITGTAIGKQTLTSVAITDCGMEFMKVQFTGTADDRAASAGGAVVNVEIDDGASLGTQMLYLVDRDFHQSGAVAITATDNVSPADDPTYTVYVWESNGMTNGRIKGVLTIVGTPR